MIFSTECRGLTFEEHGRYSKGGRARGYYLGEYNWVIQRECEKCGVLEWFFCHRGPNLDPLREAVYEILGRGKDPRQVPGRHACRNENEGV